jgi:hypothetical protein
MIILGTLPLILGRGLKIAILWAIRIVLVIGLVLFLLGSMGRTVGGREHCW